MALYAGKTLKELIGEGPIPREKARDLMGQIAAGLAKAHERNIVHRDLKPANVIVTPEGRAVVLDFGLAKLAGQLDLTVAGSTLGTAPYMSPEQLEAQATDRRTDIWSLGVMLYEMVSGSRPFRGEYQQALSYAILNLQPSPLPEDLRTEWNIVQRCLRKNPDERFQSVTGLAEALLPEGEYSGGRSVEAPVRATPRVRMRRTLAISVAVVLIGLLSWAAWRSGFLEGLFSSRSVEASAIVVLPFEDLGEPQDVYFAAGMADEIRTRLASLSALRVISANSSTRYAQEDKSTVDIGAELGVAYILSGRVRWGSSQAGQSRVRIAPTLVRVSDDTQLWADAYEERLDDVFTVQSTVATRVVHALNIELNEKEEAELSVELTDNFEAYQSYLRGVAERFGSIGYYESTESETTALDYFDEAVRLDPEFVRAHALIVRESASLARRLPPPDRDIYMRKARQAAERVRQLAPESVEQYIARGVIHLMIDGEAARAVDALRLAYERRPNDPDIVNLLARAEVSTGDFATAAELYEIASSIDPLNADPAGQSATLYALMRRDEDADRMAERAFRADPNLTWYHCVRSNGRLRLGDRKGAREWQTAAPSNNRLSCYGYGVDLFERNFDRVLRGLDSIDTSTFDWRGLGFVQLYRARALRFAGDRTGELAAWDSLRSLLTPTADIRGDSTQSVGQFQKILFLAQANAGLGDPDEAVRYLTLGRREIQGVPLEWSRWRMEMAIAYTLAGEFDEAIGLLTEDLQSSAGWLTVPFLEAPFWDPLRDRPDFRELTTR
jgi:serine/threonine protein kinase